MSFARLRAFVARQWTRRSVPWFGGVFIAVIVAFAAHDIWRTHKVAVDETGRVLESQAKIIAEQTARTLQALDVALLSIAEQYHNGALEGMGAEELHHTLRRQAESLVQADGLALVDRRGNVVATSYLHPVPPEFSRVPELTGFNLLRKERGLTLHIGDATRSRIDGRWFFPIMRALRANDGTFLGMVVARARVDYFQHFYRDVQVDDATRVALMHRDGALVARHPAVDELLGEVLPRASELLGAYFANPESRRPGRVRSPIDGIDRFAAIQTVADYPLVVVVSRDADVALAPWRNQAAGTALRTLALAALAASLLALLMRQFSDLVAARASLEESKERFTLAVAGSDDGIWDWDCERQVVFASLRAREIMGLPPGPEQLHADEWFSSIEVHPEDAPGRQAAIDAHMRGTEPAYEAEFRVRHPDGQYRWVHVRGLCVRNAAGRPLRMAGSISDIHARKTAEEALRESEEQKALAVAGSNDGVLYWDIVKDRMYSSPRAMKILGIESAVTTRPHAEFAALLKFHPDDLARQQKDLADHLAGLVAVRDGEYRILHPDGQYRWIRIRAVCVRDEQGRPLRWGGSVSDIDAQKRAEESLRQSEERYAIAMAGSNEAHWVWDVTNDELYASPMLRQLFKIPDDRVIKTRSDFLDEIQIHPDDRLLMQQRMDDHLAGKLPFLDIDYRITDRETGETRWIHTRAQAFHGNGGKVTRVGGATVDITERKRAEEALRQSEERFALAVAGSNDGIVDWDIVNDRMYSSERAMRIVGIDSNVTVRSRAEWRALIRYHPDDVERMRRDLQRVLDGETDVRDGEYRVLMPDGTYRWIRHRNMCVRDAQGRAIRLAGSLSDIDEYKRTEQALRDSEQRYELAVAGSNEGLWDWDLRTDMLYLSPRAQELIGLEPGEPNRPRPEWNALQVAHPDDQERVRAAISDYLHGRSQHFEIEYRARHAKTGEWRWYRDRGVAVRGPDGKAVRMAGSMEDITDRKTAEAERDRLEAQLRQAQKLEAMGTLAGGIAHDFNNILAAILGYGEMAQKEAGEGTALRRHIDAAMSAGMRAKSLVERILAFSRSGMGERAPVHVQSVVVEALDQLAASLPPGIVLERELACGNAAVMGDPTQIHQVVMNLCANGVQAMKNGGTLRVSLAAIRRNENITVAANVLRGGDYIRLRVADTGTGIPREIIDRIFDPFFTTKGVGAGTGLGLSLVHGIVTDLGGGVDVESEPGKGTTFTVYLPWQGEAEAPRPAAEAEVPLGNGEAILIVDDEEALVRVTEEMLAQLGYEPVGFSSSVAALESFRAEPDRFSAILSDEAMPGMTGSELAREIRKLDASIPIVLMSGYVTPALTARAHAAGVVEVLAKPLVSGDIARSLAAALRAIAPAEHPAE